MNLPPVLTAAAIRAMNPQDEFAVRIILRRVSNSSPFSLRCKNRIYILERSAAVDAHILDIPLSLWMAGANPKAVYRDNTSPCHDLFHKNALQNATLVPQIVPWGSPKPAATTQTESREGAMISLLRELCSKLGAPVEIRHAFEIIEKGLSPDDLRRFIDSAVASVDAEPTVTGLIIPNRPSPTPDAAAERMRKMREAKAAKAAAKLQPA